MQRSREIEDRTRDLYEGLKRGDAAWVADVFSRDDNVLLIGTDPEEWWPGYEAVSKVWEQQLAEIGRVDLEDSDPQGYTSGHVGWVADQPTLVVGGDLRLPLRITGVFRREDAVWRLVQWHASMGVPNREAFGAEVTTSVHNVA